MHRRLKIQEFPKSSTGRRLEPRVHSEAVKGEGRRWFASRYRLSGSLPGSGARVDADPSAVDARVKGSIRECQFSFTSLHEGCDRLNLLISKLYSKESYAFAQ
jgi:hypothetical protein